jgi:DNA modification methylase
LKTPCVTSKRNSAIGDMRKFKVICEDCRDKAKELKQSFVDLNLVVTLLTNIHPM